MIAPDSLKEELCAKFMDKFTDQYGSINHRFKDGVKWFSLKMLCSKLNITTDVIRNYNSKELRRTSTNSIMVSMRVAVSIILNFATGNMCTFVREQSASLLKDMVNASLDKPDVGISLSDLYSLRKHLDAVIDRVRETGGREIEELPDVCC